MKTNGKTPATARNEIRRSQSFAWYLKPLFTTSTKMLRFFILTKAQLSLILQKILPRERFARQRRDFRSIR